MESCVSCPSCMPAEVYRPTKNPQSWARLRVLAALNDQSLPFLLSVAFIDFPATSNSFSWPGDLPHEAYATTPLSFDLWPHRWNFESPYYSVMGGLRRMTWVQECLINGRSFLPTNARQRKISPSPACTTASTSPRRNSPRTYEQTREQANPIGEKITKSTANHSLSLGKGNAVQKISCSKTITKLNKGEPTLKSIKSTSKILEIIQGKTRVNSRRTNFPSNHQILKQTQ